MKTIELIFWICMGIVFYTYLGYGILLYIMVKIKEFFSPPRPPKKYSDDELPEVTLLVAAYNEEEVVKEKMENTLALDYPADKLRLMWVTDGSNDRTNERLQQYPRVKVLHRPERMGKTAALNRAIDFVETPLVIFTDANTMLNKESIREIVHCFADERVGCVAGEKRVVSGGNDGAAGGGEGLYWKYESALKRLDSRLYSTMGAAGELFAVRTHLFEKMESDTLLDDFILSMRIVEKGGRIAYCSEAYAMETGSANMKEEQKRKVRIAAGGLQSIVRLKSLLNIFRHGIVTFQYVSHRVLRWSVTPVCLFALLPLNMVLAFFTEGWDAICYCTILMLQLLFYLMGYQGYLLSLRNVKSRLLYVPYYFLFMNINVIRGFFYLRKKGGSGVWEKAKRA